MNEKTKPVVSVVVVILVIAFFIAIYFVNKNNAVGPVACTMDAMECPDGSFVGRVGPDCQFAQCPAPAEVVQYKDLIRVTSPKPGDVITSPLTIRGEARGNWYFEASFPISLTNWDGLIIAEHYAQAQGEWMTEEYVPFEAVLEFDTPLNPLGQDFMKNGTLILRKDNASGLPEHDDAFEIPVKFSN